MFPIRCSILASKANLTKLNYLRSLNLQRTSSSFQQQSAEYFKKNEELKRPISPYVMYKPQITSVLSITHRMTGIGLSLPLYAFGISQLLINNNWANQLVSLQAICPNLFLATKFLIIGSFYFHLLNGVRHLAWDLGKGFKLRQLYASGYTVIALSVLLTAITMSNL